MLKVADVSQVVIGGGMVGALYLMQHAFNTRLNQDLIPVLHKANLMLENSLQSVRERSSLIYSHNKAKGIKIYAL